MLRIILFSVFVVFPRRVVRAIRAILKIICRIIWRIFCVLTLTLWTLAAFIAAVVYRRRDAADRRLARHIRRDLENARQEIAALKQQAAESEQQHERDRQRQREDHVREIECLQEDLRIRDKHIESLAAVITRDRERVEMEAARFSRRKQEAIGFVGEHQGANGVNEG